MDYTENAQTDATSPHCYNLLNFGKFKKTRNMKNEKKTYNLGHKISSPFTLKILFPEKGTFEILQHAS